MTCKGLGRWAAGLVLLAGAANGFAEESGLSDAADLQALREAARNRQRRIIFNNDGDDYSRSSSFETFLDNRTRPLLGSQVDSIFYSTSRSGFLFSHRTKVGRTIDREPMHRFLKRDTDPLEVMIGFCREHDIEIFWSFRMNDTHDAWRKGDMKLENTRSLKVQHPEWMIGRRDQRPKYGAWSAFDYAQPAVRDRAAAIVQEVCRNYDVDGVELDFFRHPMFFKTVAWGEAAGPEEWEMMNGVVRRIREVLDREGQRRGRPFLLAVRSPDDLEFNRKLGLDLETWLQQGWVDLWVVTGYFQLRPWKDSVDLGHQYGARVYACLSESRVTGFRSRKPSRMIRLHPRAYHGRALNAWIAGADGMYLFNSFNPRSPLWRELGDPALLRTLDRDYFALPRGVGHPAGGTWPYRFHMKIPTLNPEDPLTLRRGVPGTMPLLINEDLFALLKRDPDARVTARVMAPAATDPADLQVALNETELGAPRRDGDWWVFTPPAEAFLIRWNTFRFTWEPEVAAGKPSTVDVTDLMVRVDVR